MQRDTHLHLTAQNAPSYPWLIDRPKNTQSTVLRVNATRMQRVGIFVCFRRRVDAACCYFTSHQEGSGIVNDCFRLIDKVGFCKGIA